MHAHKFVELSSLSSEGPISNPLFPTAALVENTIFCMHGGLSPDLYDPRELNKIERPLDIPNKGVLCDLLWSDPDPVRSDSPLPPTF